MNKNMKKYKNRQFHFSVVDMLMVLVLILSVFAILFFAREYEKINEKFNIAKTNVTHIIQTPSNEQIEEFKQCNDIDEIVPYYFCACKMKYSDKIFKADMFLIDTVEDLDKTLFSDELLKSSACNQGKDVVFIDKVLADKYGIASGDIVSLMCDDRTMECGVEAIYCSDGRHDAGMVMAEYSGAIKQFVDPDGILEYSGAYICSNNETATDITIKDYKPLGDLRTRDEFNSDELYQDYLKLRDEADSTQTTFFRSQYIKDLQMRYRVTSTKNIGFAILAAVLEGVIGCLYFILHPGKYIKNDLLRDVRNNFTIAQEKEMMNAYFLVSLFSLVIVMVIEECLFYFLGNVSMIWAYALATVIPFITIIIAKNVVCNQLKTKFVETVKKVEEEKRKEEENRRIMIDATRIHE